MNYKMGMAMKIHFKEYLFDKHYFVYDSKKSEEDAFSVMYGKRLALGRPQKVFPTSYC